MTLDQIHELTKSISPKVAKARLLQEAIYRLSFRHIGKDLKVEYLEGYESKAQKSIKKLLSRNWAYPLYEVVTDYLRQWVDQNKLIEIEGVNSEYEEAVKNIYSGKSIQYYIDEVFGRGIFHRFQDFIVVDKTTAENDNDVVKPILSDISINHVVDYGTNGFDITYLLYEVDQVVAEGQIKYTEYRYYGALEDGYLYIYDFKKEGDKFILQSRIRIERDENNPVDVLPIRQVGSLLDKETDFNIKKSRIDSIIDSIESYQRLYDIHEISKVIHAFPEKISISIPCPTCNGSKTIRLNSNEGPVKCTTCNGSGRWVATNPSDITFVPIKLNNGDSLAFPDMVKYVQKDDTILKLQHDFLEDLWIKIINIATGISKDVASGMKTATEVVENKVPLNKKLNKIITSDVEPCAEWIYKQVNKIWFGSPNFNVKVKYQEFYTGLSSNSIIVQIKEMQEAGFDPVLIREKQIDYIRSVYPEDLEKQEKLINELQTIKENTNE